LIKLFRSRIGLRYSKQKARQRGCRCIIRLILQLDVTLSANSWHAFLIAFLYLFG
jgi:hypothetical protein